MPIFWSLKTAAENEPLQVAPVVPQPVLPTQQAIPTNIEPKAVPQPQQNVPNIQNWQKNNQKRFLVILNFVKRNIDETEFDAWERVVHFKQNPEEWETFKQCVDAVVLNESFDEFVARLTANQKNTDIKGIDELPNLAALQSDINETVIPTMENILHLWKMNVIEKNIDFGMPPYSFQNEQSAAVAAINGIGGAIENFFTGAYQGHITKWISFAYKNAILPKGAIALIQSKGGISSGAYEHINKWYASKSEIYPALNKIMELAKDEDGNLLKALAECAMSLGSEKGQSGASLDISNSQGDKIQHQDKVSLTPDQNLEQAKKDQQLSIESLESGGELADNFIQNNPEYIENLKTVKHPTTGEAMLPALIKGGVGDEVNLIESAIRDAFVGKGHEMQQNHKTKQWYYTDNVEYDQWVDFFVNNPEALSGTKVKPGDIDDILKNEEKLFPIFINSMSNPEVLKKYMGNPSGDTPSGIPYEYLRYLYDVNRIHDKQMLAKEITGFGNIQQFKRIGDMSVGVLKRDFETSLSQNGMDNRHTKSVARSYAFTKSKAESYMNKLRQLMNTHEQMPLTKSSFVQRDENNVIKIWVATKNGYTDDPNVDPKAGILNPQNISELTKLVRNNEWVVKGAQLLEKICPGALKKEGASNKKILSIEEMPPLEQEYKKATDEYQQNNPNSKDRLGGYRLKMAEKCRDQVASLGQKLGVAFKNVDEMVNFIDQRIQKKKLGNKSDIGKNAKTFLHNLLTGKTQNFGPSDLKAFSKLLIPTPEESASIGEPVVDANKAWPNVLSQFYVDATEYDPYNADARNNIDNIARGAFTTFGPYLVHKKREQMRRGMVNDLFKENSLLLFLSIIPPLPAASGQGVDANYSHYLYELVGKRPTGTSFTWDQIEQTMKDNPLTDDYQKMPKIPMSKKRYYRSTMHPSGIETREEELDRDEKAFTGKDKKIPYADLMGGKTLEDWQETFIEQMNNRVADKSPEVLKQRMSSGEDPVSISKEILTKEYSKNHPTETADPEQLFNSRMSRFNNSLKKFNPEKQYSADEFAHWFIEKQIETKEYFRNRAIKQKKELDNTDITKLSPKKKFDLFVPTRFKTEKKNLAPIVKRPVLLDMGELKNLAKSDIPERYKQRLSQEPAQQVAIDYVKERKSLDDESSVAFLKDRMRRFNRSKMSENGVELSFDEYLKHYMEEAIIFETNYRAEAQKSLQESPGKKVLFPKRSSVDAIKRAITRLSYVEDLIARVGKYGKRKDYIRLIDSIADESIAEIMDG